MSFFCTCCSFTNLYPLCSKKGLAVIDECVVILSVLTTLSNSSHIAVAKPRRW